MTPNRQPKQPLTPFERRVRARVVELAQGGSPADPRQSCITYLRLGAEIDPTHTLRYPSTRPPFRGFNGVLGNISQYEHEHGRPLLTALVVRKATGTPGSGFANLVRSVGLPVTSFEKTWFKHLVAVVTFWSGTKDPDEGM